MSGRKKNWENELWDGIAGNNGQGCPTQSTCKLPDKELICIENPDRWPFLRNLHSFLDGEELTPGIVDGFKPPFPRCLWASTLHRLVTKLADKYRDAKWDGRLPVPDNLITEDSDGRPIEVRRIPLKTVHGAMWSLDDGWIVQINSYDSPARQRYTIYHEIFHVFAHYNSNPEFRKFEGIRFNFNEGLADHFAAHLLIPAESVRGEWEKIHDVEKIADAFLVPRPIMYFTIKTLGLT